MKNQQGDDSGLEQRNREFLVLLGKHELKIAACVHALVPSWQEAEDVLQETRLQLWQEFDKFEPGSDFLAWARTVARYAVRTHFQKQRRQPLILSADVGELVLAKLAQKSAQSDRRLETLADCVRKLTEDAFDLLRRCYIDRQKIKDVAAELQRSLTGTYSALSRIRRDLFDCMQEHLRQDEKKS